MVLFRCILPEGLLLFIQLSVVALVCHLSLINRMVLIPV
jgi:hypothetical protein